MDQITLIQVTHGIIVEALDDLFIIYINRNHLFLINL